MKRVALRRKYHRLTWLSTGALETSIMPETMHENQRQNHIKGSVPLSQNKRHRLLAPATLVCYGERTRPGSLPQDVRDKNAGVTKPVVVFQIQRRLRIVT